MKKFLAMMIVMTLLLSCLSLCVNAQYDLTYTALKGTPTIDGEIDAIWNDKNVEWTTVEHPYSEKDTRADQVLNVKVLWDEEALYFLAKVTCTPEDLADFGNLFEIYISEANTKSEGNYTAGDSQTCVRFVDASFVGNDYRGDEGPGTNTKGGNEKSKAAGKKLSDGYLLEVKLPFVTIAGEAGKKIGLEFMLNILDKDSKFINALRWNVDTAGALGTKDKAPWQSTEAWGVLILGNNEATAPVVEQPETSTPAEDNPKTGDMFSIYAVVALVSLAGATVVAKKRG